MLLLLQLASSLLPLPTTSHILNAARSVHAGLNSGARWGGRQGRLGGLLLSRDNHLLTHRLRSTGPNR